MENTSLGWENTLNSQKHGKILSSYAECKCKYHIIHGPALAPG